MKFKKIMLLIIASLNIIFYDIAVNASEIHISNTYYDNTIEIQPKADIIGWRYKTIDNKLYRRQYNYTKQMWIGNYFNTSKSSSA